jgi:hypothetical protein
MTVGIGADSFSMMVVLAFRAVSQEVEVMDAYKAIGRTQKRLPVHFLPLALLIQFIDHITQRLSRRVHSPVGLKPIVRPGGTVRRKP